MSDGLFQPDPISRSQARAPESDTQQSELPKDGAAGESRDGLPQGPTTNKSQGGVTEDPDISPQPFVSDKHGTEQPTSVEPPGLGGLAEEQLEHRPSDVPPPRPAVAVAVDRVSESETEAPLSFRVVARLCSAATGPTAVTLALGFAGLVGLYIYSQVLAIVSSLATLPGWLSTIAVVFLSILIAFVVLAFGRLVFAYVRLRRNQQLRMRDMQQLYRHAEIRRGCSPSQERQKAKAVLEEYIRAYPEYEDGKPDQQSINLDRKADVSIKALFSGDQLDRLRRVRRRLSDPARVKDSREWLDIYATQFQSVLDAAARDRVHQCAKWVGVKTAISPNALVDTLITIYWSFTLLRDLCMIYNVRVGFVGTAALLWRAFFSAYLAGRLQEWEEHADDTIESMMDGLPEIGRKMVGKVAAKAGTGLANYFLVRRLGKRAIMLLRPLSI